MQQKKDNQPDVKIDKDGSFTINIPVPAKDVNPLFEVELSPVLSVDQLAKDLDLERADLIEAIKSNTLEGYHFEKEKKVPRYKGIYLKENSEFYVTGHGLTCK